MAHVQTIDQKLSPTWEPDEIVVNWVEITEREYYAESERQANHKIKSHQVAA